MSHKGIIRVTLSMGISILHASDDASVESVLNEADVALYRAQEKGRNRVEWSECGEYL
jgi:PleD family two-component response regulator